jgi:RecB family exonuclease
VVIKIRLSKSAIEAFLYCKYSFYLKYIVKFKTPPNEAMRRGTTFHSFCQTFYDKIVNLPIESWDTLVDTSLPEDEQEYQRWFIEEEKIRYKKLQATGDEDLFPPAYREIHLTSVKHKMHGYVDAIRWVNKEEKTLALVEYKTSKKHKPGDVKRELAYYRLLWEDTMSDVGTIVETIIINPQCKTNVTSKVSVRNMTAATNAIAKIRDAIARDAYEKPLNMFCCKYCNLCELYEKQTKKD